MGVKLVVVCGLALLMTIPAFLVGGLVEDRTSRAADVTREVSALVGGRQTFLGPTLAIPYSIQLRADTVIHGVYLVFPEQASAAVKTATEERRRSLFKVPVFQADLAMQAKFDLTGVPAYAPQGAILDWSRAEIVVGVSDARGALADATLSVNGKTSTLALANTSGEILLANAENQQEKLILFGQSASDYAKPGAQFSLTSNLRFSGAQRIALLAFGKSTRISMQGDWPSPGFDGGFLPVSRSISRNGFAAEWSVPFIARGVRAEGPVESIGGSGRTTSEMSFSGLNETALGVSFIEVADPYQSVNRSLKYIALFLGLIFLSYFIFEVTTGKRVHPAQYILVGVAQLIFYLLLLSLSERIGFDFGFLIGGAATVGLLSANAGWVFASRILGIKALAVFTLVYTLIYMLLRLEDDALLVGAIASFVAVAAAMYFTRSIDWYSSPSGSKAAPGGDQLAPGTKA